MRTPGQRRKAGGGRGVAVGVRRIQRQRLDALDQVLLRAAVVLRERRGWLRGFPLLRLRSWTMACCTPFCCRRARSHALASNMQMDKWIATRST